MVLRIERFMLQALLDEACVQVSTVIAERDAAKASTSELVQELTKSHATAKR